MRVVLLFQLVAPVFLSVCVSQSAYDARQAKSDARAAQIKRLIGAISYTVNSDPLFASGSWQLRPEGKDIIAT
jgi:chemotaxis protein MotB